MKEIMAQKRSISYKTDFFGVCIYDLTQSNSNLWVAPVITSPYINMQ